MLGRLPRSAGRSLSKAKDSRKRGSKSFLGRGVEMPPGREDVRLSHRKNKRFDHGRLAQARSLPIHHSESAKMAGLMEARRNFHQYKILARFVECLGANYHCWPVIGIGCVVGVAEWGKDYISEFIARHLVVLLRVAQGGA